MASIQCRHVRDCALGWTKFDFDTEQCSCPPRRGPTYYICDREIPGGKLKVGRNRRVAERELTRVQGEISLGTYQPIVKIGFSTWADRWLALLDSLKKNTRRTYAQSIECAKEYFREKRVDKITPTDIGQFNKHLEGFGLSPSSRHKHVSTLSTCLSSAIAHGHARTNPVAALPANERPKKAKNEAAYFENKEIQRVLDAMSEGVEKLMCLLALMTGMRIGELLGLRWWLVDLQTGTIRVLRSYADTTKHDVFRDVDLPEPAIKLLATWKKRCGKPEPTALVFPPGAMSRTGFLSSNAVNVALQAAMSAAKVPAIGPSGEKRTFHSLRHTFAKTALEQGIPLTWLQRQLGHSTIAVTANIYGHWEREERKRMAKKLNRPFARFVRSD